MTCTSSTSVLQIIAWIGAFTGPVIAALALWRAVADRRRREQAVAKALLYLVHHTAAMAADLAERLPGAPAEVGDYMRGEAIAHFRKMADEKLAAVDIFQIPATTAIDAYHRTRADCIALAELLPMLSTKPVPEAVAKLREYQGHFGAHAVVAARVAKSLGARLHVEDHDSLAHYLTPRITADIMRARSALARLGRRKTI